MKRFNRLPIPSAWVALLVICGLPARCFALDVLKELSREDAAKLGIAVETQSRRESHDVRVQVEFKPASPNKPPTYVNLDVTQGGKRLVYAALMPVHPSAGTTRFAFYIDPTALPDASIIVTEVGAPLPGHGYVLHLKEYLPAAAAR